MPGVSLVSAEYFRGHLKTVRLDTEELRSLTADIPTLNRHGWDYVGIVVRRLSFSARCLMRSDCAEATDAERREAFNLIDESAGIIARYQHHWKS